MKKSYNLLPRSCDNNKQQQQKQQEAIRNVKVKLFLSFFVSSAFLSLIISAASTNELSQAEDLLKTAEEAAS